MSRSNSTSSSPLDAGGKLESVAARQVEERAVEQLDGRRVERDGNGRPAERFEAAEAERPPATSGGIGSSRTARR